MRNFLAFGLIVVGALLLCSFVSTLPHNTDTVIARLTIFLTIFLSVGCIGSGIVLAIANTKYKS
ncbi:hypothetical protein [Tengunoibacter tsumagoiensis]|uniref:Uncharacterized protein n=1 Tax=Tengunoibacter tsumagoiensis TaxID=2014871 RepID=A0A402A3H3_9CHLR|nr:hypothetical protein [Tengunoibacter tsumagoiensis]GCE13700.1 hypothetical protein KTT_35590 [Tengunoibacter tsumagoiensis]